MIFFLNLTLLSSRCSFQLSSHLEYVFITKIIFKELFNPLQSLFIITDRANLALLTWPPVIGVKTRGHIIYWPCPQLGELIKSDPTLISTRWGIFRKEEARTVSTLLYCGRGQGLLVLPTDGQIDIDYWVFGCRHMSIANIILSGSKMWKTSGKVQF